MKTLLRLMSIPDLLFLCLLTLRYGLQWRVLKRSEAKASPNGVSSLERVTLGGVEQFILIQGDDVRFVPTIVGMSAIYLVVTLGMSFNPAHSQSTCIPAHLSPLLLHLVVTVHSCERYVFCRASLRAGSVPFS